MNTPHQCCDSFSTLLATRSPVRTAVDVTPLSLILEGVAGVRCVFDVPADSPCCWCAYPPSLLTPHRPRWLEESPGSQREPTHNRLSPLVMLVSLPLQQFVFRSSWISVIWLHLFHASINMDPTHAFTCIYRMLQVQKHSLKNATPLKARICALRHTSCIRWIKKIRDRSCAFSGKGAWVGLVKMYWITPLKVT